MPANVTPDLGWLGLRQLASRYETPRAPGTPIFLHNGSMKLLWSTFLREHRHSVEHCITLNEYPSIPCLLDFPRPCPGCMHFCKALNSLQAVDQDCEEDYTE